MLISLDTESTGLDWAHGAMPFLVTTCDDSGVIRYWEWDVDPLTRRPDVPEEDISQILELIDTADLIYLQNSKYDAHMLDTIGITLPWPKVRDTLIMGHLLASNHPHDLTSMCISYLGRDIEKYELAVKEAVQTCRAIVKKEYPTWRIAHEGAEGMPSVKESSKRDEDKPWKNDMWLPRVLAKAKGKVSIFRLHNVDVPNLVWLEAASRYANADSEHTLALGLEMESLIQQRGYWATYEHRLQLMRVDYEMEAYGVTTIGSYTESTIEDYERYVADAASELHCIASEYDHDLELAEGAAINDNMRDFFYGALHQTCSRCGYRKRIKHWNNEQGLEESTCPKCAKGKRKQAGVVWRLSEEYKPNLNLHVIAGKKSGNASLDKDVMQEYLTTLDEGPALDFIRLLASKRKHDTDLTYMRAYRRFWLPVPGAPGYFRIHPSINPCGTDHLRQSSNNPNLQNVGKQEMRCEECNGKGCNDCGGSGLKMLSARNCFGPAPDREWWSMDYNQIEKRIPAYECMEPALVELFEKPNAPPYWGSDHNLLASILFPDLYWAVAEIHPDKEGSFKKRYINEYKRTKNTNFAKQYGAGKRKVDATAGVSGAYELISRGMPRLAELQAHYLHMAEKTGWVYTLPSRAIDPTKGYPILAGKTDEGRVLSTTPFNYHVSGTACECKNVAMVRCSAQLAEWREEGFDAHMPLEIHDELLFDFPRGETWEENYPRAMVLRKIMKQSGEDLIPRIPTPVSVEYHTHTWAKGIAC